RFVYQNMLDDATRARLDNAWHDLYASFKYHDTYLRMLAEHYKYDLKGVGIAQMDAARIAALPEEMRQYVPPLGADYKAAMAAQVAGRPGKIEVCLKFASHAWRRPLSEVEKSSLRAFYQKTLASEQDHTKTIRALLTRILVSPAFLYRVEQPPLAAAAAAVDPPVVKPLSQWEMASRLSYFLWASIPDDELRRAAAAAELSDSQRLQAQVKRMLADPKAR